MAGEFQYNGVLLINKPVGLTSHDVIDRLRHSLGQRGGGHTGTLDPLAGGLLIACLGRATKISRFLMGLDKEYEAAVRLGVASETFDAEGVGSDAGTDEVPRVNVTEIREVTESFVGNIKQTVPPYAAVRVEGKKLYERARKGQKVDLPTRQVTISSIDVLSYDPPDLYIRVACSKGTYIRSLAHDIGQRLGCGSYLKELTRTRIGQFKLEDALTLDRVAELHNRAELDDRIMSIEQALPLGAIKVTDEFAPRVRHGIPVTWKAVAGFEGRFGAGEDVALKDSRGSVLAVGTAGIPSDEKPGAENAQLFRYGRVLQ